MKHIIADHSSSAFLHSGEIIISSNPILVSTILGSCVAVTMYAPKKGIGAICHAMLPKNTRDNNDFRYVDTAVRYLHRKMIERAGNADLVIKVFGGAQVLAGGHSADSKQSVGEQNLTQVKKSLDQLGLLIAQSDTGGTLGRKLFFSMKTGYVYLRKLNLRNNECTLGEMP